MRTMFGSTSCNLPSRFLEEIPKDLLDGYEEAFGLTETFSKAENKENNYTWTYGNSRANKTKIYNINDLKDKTVAVASNIMGKGAAFGRTAESFLSNLGKKNEAQPTGAILTDTSDVKGSQPIRLRRFVSIPMKMK